jgi:type IV pilus assembly protein PilM
MFGGKKSLVGLDIGSSAVKAVELKQTKKGFQLVHFRMVPLPPEAIVDGAIMNSGAVVEAVSELIATEKIKNKEVATSVSGHSVIVKKIKLPQMTEEELEESIQWEAEQYIPFDITDVNLDVQILGPDEQNVGQMEVLLVAAKKDMINDHMAVLHEAGLTPLVMDVDAFAIENMFEANYGVTEGETVVLANIGASATNVNILRGGVSTFTRDISIGGAQFTEEIQKQLNVSHEEAESLKLGGDLGAPTETTEAVIPQEVGGIIRSVSESVAIEIQRSLDFFAATATDDKIAKIYLMGGSSKVPGLSSVVEAKLGISTEVANPFKAVQINEKNFNLAHITEVAPAAAVAMGLALRYVGDR